MFGRSVSQSVSLRVLLNDIPDETSNFTCDVAKGFLFLSAGRSALCTIESKRLGLLQNATWQNFVPAIAAGEGVYRS